MTQRPLTQKNYFFTTLGLIFIEFPVIGFNSMTEQFYSVYSIQSFSERSTYMIRIVR